MRKENFSVLKLSKDSSFLLAYNDMEGHEQFIIFNTNKNEKTWEGVLDLSAGRIREDPTRLMKITGDNLSLFIRGRDRKSIVMHSLFDGSVIMKSGALHTNYIV
jgi:hypothetical protein